MRIYRQYDETSRDLQPFMTRHFRIESLREMRLLIFQAKSVYVQIERNTNGEVATLLDLYGRRLTNTWCEDSVGSLGSLAKTLALHGYTFSFYTTEIQECVDSAMPKAMVDQRRIFNLSEEVFTNQFRPWEIRNKWDRNPDIYEEYRHILNLPSQQELYLIVLIATPRCNEMVDGMSFLLLLKYVT